MKKQFTTIQISLDFAPHIRKWCKDRDVVVGRATERLWETVISSSMIQPKTPDVK